MPFHFLTKTSYKFLTTTTTNPYPLYLFLFTQNLKFFLNENTHFFPMISLIFSKNLNHNLSTLKYSDKILIEIIEGENLVNIDENFNLTALSEGSVKLRVCMEENNEIYQEMTINIKETAPEIVTYQLIGDESIKWGRTKIYQCIKNTNGIEELVPCTFTVEDNDKLLKEYEINNSTITISANENNNIGTIKLIAEFEDKRLEKEIGITSLWM